MLHLLVATTDGYLYCYRLGTGGECELVKQHRLISAFALPENPPAGGLQPLSEPSTGGAIPVRPPRSSDPPSSEVPNPNDLDEFPPMSHKTG